MAYVGLCKALYDYEAQAADELTLKEDDVVYILNADDPEWWKAKLKKPDATPDDDADDAPIGLVPANYVEQAEPLRLSRALYDYSAQNDDELDMVEDELLRIYESDGLWLLVKKQGDDAIGEGGQGKLGYVPANYVDEVAAEDTGVVPVAQEVVDEEQEEEEAPATTSGAIPLATTTVKSIAADKADAIKMWGVSALDSKKKKKKGTLGIGNASLFFASESDKMPVQKVSILHIDAWSLEAKGKQLSLSISPDAGIEGDELNFYTGSKDVSDEVGTKIDESKENAKSAPPPTNGSAGPASAASPSNPRSVPPPAFKPPSAVPVPSPPKTTTSLPPPTRKAVAFQTPALAAQPSAIAVYDFEAQGDDELSVAENEPLTVVEKENDDWWKVRNAQGKEGVVPASYIEESQDSAPAPTSGSAQNAEQDAAAAAAAEAEERERQEEEAAAEAAAQEAAEAARRRVREESERKRREALKAQPAPALPKADDRIKTSEATKAAKEVKIPEGKSAPERPTNATSKSKPAAKHTRIWHDRTGQFKVEAEFLGFNHGKIRLHKLNGVVIEVAVEKMSDNDIRFLEEVTGKRLTPDAAKTSSSSRRGGESSLAKDVERRRREGPGGASASRAREIEREKEKERQRRRERERGGESGQAGGSSSGRPKRNVDWFEFFLAASVDVDDCTRYAAAFERDKIDEALLPELEAGTLRSLGLREGDIIRVLKFIERKYKPQRSQQRQSSTAESQLKADEEMARKLQAQESAARGGTSSSTPPPGLFSGPGGTLKNNTRRGRPTPTSKTSSGVDAASLAAASQSLARTDTPPARAATASPEVVAQPPAKTTASAMPATPVGGFDDDAWTPRPPSAKPATPAAPAAPTPPPAPVIAAAPPPPPTPPAPPADPNSALFDKLAAMKAPSAASPVANRPGASPSNGSGMMGQSFNPHAPRGPLAPVPGNQGLLQPLISTQGTGQFLPTRQNPMATGMGMGMSMGMGMQPQQTGYGNGMMQPQATGWGGGSPASPFGMSAQQTGFPGMMAQPTGYGQQQQPMMTNISGFASPPAPGGMMPQQTGFPGLQAQSSPLQSAAQPTNQQNGGAASPANKFAASNIFAQMKTGQFAKDPNAAAQAPDKYDALRPQPTGFQPGGVQLPYGMGMQPQQTGFQQGGFPGQQQQQQQPGQGFMGQQPTGYGMYGAQGQQGFGYQY